MKRILIVDEREEVRTVLAMLLQQYGYETFEAMDGSQVLPMVVEHSADLVLLDLAMPIMDGFDALRQLKGDDRTKDVPVIVITARTDVSNRDRALSMGIEDYIIKPFSVVDVLGRINTVLGRNGSSPS